MQSLQFSPEENTANARSQTSPPAPFSAAQGNEHGHEVDSRTQAAAIHATLTTLFKLRQKAAVRDRYDEISRAMSLSQMPVTEALSSSDAEVRQNANRTVNGLMATLDKIADKKRQVNEVMEQLLQETIEARIRRRWQNVKSVMLGALMLLAYLRVGTQLFHFWWMVFPLSGLMAADRLAYWRRQAARLLGEASEPRAVGVLAVALRDSDQAVRDTAADALYRLLPRVRASDAAYIDADQMSALLGIAYQADQELKLALLQALEQIGDARAIPAVRDMTLYGSDEVRQQAAACMPFLLERERRARESVTLLRASRASSAGPDQLLRPVDQTDSTPPDQMLRATAIQ